MSKTLRIATRKSPLALWQANEVGRLLTEFHPDLNVELVTMKTKGDKILDTPLAKVGGKGLFVKELETGMLEGKADIAVHSMKDVPINFPDGLHLPVILERENPRDAFVSNRFASLDELPADAKIGTCSLRRQTQLREKMPAIEILDLRGSVNTRLQKLDDGNFDAIILASSGLMRLGYESRIAQHIPTTRSLPAVGQGAIGIECREDDDYINELIAPLNHRLTSLRVRAERAMNTRLNGGCQVPIAGYAVIQEDQLTLRGLVGYPDGSALFRSEETGLATDGEALGIAVAEDILSQGGDKALEAVGIDV